MLLSMLFFSNLEFEYYCEYYPEILLQVRLNKKLKLMGVTMKNFPKKNYWAMK